MKRFLILMLIPIYGRSQPSLPMKDGRVFYEAVDSVAADKAELYNRSRVWFVNTFKSAKSVLQMDDKESGIVMGKGVTEFEIGNLLIGSLESYIHYTISINLKDGKYRIQIYDIYVSNSDNGATYTPENLLKYPKMNKKRLRRIDDDAKETIASFRAALVKKSAADF